MDDNPERTYWPTWAAAVKCAERKFEKNETFTIHQFHERCGIDYGTATKYLPLMTGQDLGGGKKIVRTPIAIENGYVVDPPGEDSVEAARSECCRVCRCVPAGKASSGNNFWRKVLVPVALGALIISVTGLVELNSKRTMFSCRVCGAVIDLARWSQPSVTCPNCGELYVREPAP